MSKALYGNNKIFDDVILYFKLRSGTEKVENPNFFVFTRFS